MSVSECVGGCGWVHLHTGVGSILHRCQQWGVHGVKGHSECTVDDAAIDVSPEVNLADVVILQHCVVSGIGGVVCRTVVQGAASRERQPWGRHTHTHY